MKSLLLIARVFAGLVFVFSGFVKAIDPAGSAIKFEEYFLAFHMDFLGFMSFPLAIILSSSELMIGLNLLARARMKLTAWLLLIFMTFFTMLTLILAIANPVSDCGCFGDAIKLTNWQTFGKNVFLLLPTLFIFLNRKKYTPVATPFTESYIMAINFILPSLLSAFCIYHQPILDFRPYKYGTHIPTAMTIPEGAPAAKYETILVYQKDGVRKEFTEDNYPWQDSTWKWVETKQNLISKGYEPPIHDFSITTSGGEDLTEKILSDSGYVWLIIAPKIERSSTTGMQRLNNLALKVRESGMAVYCLTSSATSGIEQFKTNFDPAFEICSTDETTLKTIIRANPGLLLLHEGIILAKWNHRDAPKPAELQQNPLQMLLQIHRRTFESLTIITLVLFGIFLLYRILSR